MTDPSHARTADRWAHSPFVDEELFSYPATEDSSPSEDAPSPFLHAFETTPLDLDDSEEPRAWLDPQEESADHGAEGTNGAEFFEGLFEDGGVDSENEEGDGYVDNEGFDAENSDVDFAGEGFDSEGDVDNEGLDDDELNAPAAFVDEASEDDEAHPSWGLEPVGRTDEAEAESPDLEQGLFEQELFEIEVALPPADIEAGVAALAKEWSTRRNGSPGVTAMTTWLLGDYRDTMKAAHIRWRKKGNYSDESIARAWLVSRREHMHFQLSFPSGLQALRNFHPPSEHVALVRAPSLIGNSDVAPVAPLMVRFIEELQRRYLGRFRADTYAGHGGGEFDNRGYSVDLWLEGTDPRGFFPPDRAIALLRAVDATARATQTSWRVLYNDFQVADALNRETGRRHVAFMGRVRRSKSGAVSGLNWHGPHPLIRHFHLDIAPGVQPAALGISTTAPPQTPVLTDDSPSPQPPPAPAASPAASSPPGSAGPVSATVAVIGRALRVAEAVAAVVAGERDENRLTNIIFYARHPDLPSTYKIGKHETVLAREWHDIRSKSVRPVLAALSKAAAQAATPATVPTAPGATTAPGGLGTLVEMHHGVQVRSYRFTAEDRLWTARFITGEAGGRDDLDNAAVIQAMFNRFILLLYPQYYRTFHGFLQRYSTPLQPVLQSWGAAKRHYKSPGFVATGGHYVDHPEIPRGQLQRHLDLQVTPWSGLPESARGLASRALAGAMPNPGIGLASEFASTNIYFKSRYNRTPTDAEWRKYTLDVAKQKKDWIWVGDVPKINQRKNAFFLRSRHANRSAADVRVIV